MMIHIWDLERNAGNYKRKFVCVRVSILAFSPNSFHYLSSFILFFEVSIFLIFRIGVIGIAVNRNTLRMKGGASISVKVLNYQ